MQALQLHCSELRIVEWWCAATAAAVRAPDPYSAARGLLDLVAAATRLQVRSCCSAASRDSPWGCRVAPPLLEIPLGVPFSNYLANRSRVGQWVSFGT